MRKIIFEICLCLLLIPMAGAARDRPCQKCGTSQPEDNRYCKECGEKYVPKNYGWSPIGFGRIPDEKVTIVGLNLLSWHSRVYGVSAGFCNDSDEMYGVSAGLVNEPSEMCGFAFGVWNLGCSGAGLFVAGLSNIITNANPFSVEFATYNCCFGGAAVQVGCVNALQGASGLQFGGFNFMEDNSSGLQFGGFNFMEDNSSGMQVGLYNSASGKARCFQLGAVNNVDASSSCLQVGVLNFGKKDPPFNPIIRAQW